MQKTLKVVAVVIAIGFSAIILANSFDEELNPGVRDVLDHPPAVSPQAVAGFKYLLGIRVRANEDPVLAGEKIYARAKERLANTGAKALKIYFCLVKGSYRLSWATPIAPTPPIAPERPTKSKRCKSMLHSPRTPWPFNAIKLWLIWGCRPRICRPPGVIFTFNALRLEFMELSGLVHHHQYQTLWPRITAIAQFANNSLEFPHSLVETNILLLHLKMAREFIAGAAAEYPAFKKAIPPNVTSALILRPSYESIAQGVRSYNLRTIADAMSWPLNLSYFELSSLGEEIRPSESWRQMLSGRTTRFFLKKNQSLNLAMQQYDQAAASECVRSADVCPEPADLTWKDYFVNPLGKAVVSLMVLHPQALQRIYQLTH